ncbi:hypothetical protein HYT01_00840 [Candidatus Giovannonibacteria bacterium]|nr:hypothetical protein [Candidatus Giovannonibacteria bacterium]
MKPHTSFGLVALVLVVLFVLWAVGLFYRLYFVFWWYDVLLHFIGGFWVLILARSAKANFNWELSGRHSATALVLGLLGIVVLVGAIWEMGEFVSDRYILMSGYTKLPKVYEDTLADLLMDLLGGLFGIIYYKCIRIKL